MIRLFTLCSALVLTLLSATMAEAQAKGYAGLLLGMSVPDADDTSARPMYGVQGGARLDGEFGLGAFYLTSKKEETVNAVKTDYDYNLYGLEGSFHFEGVADGAYIAARIGLAKVDVGTVNYSPMIWGLLFGYDHFLSEKFSLGIEGGFTSVQGDDNGTNNLDGFTMLNFLVAAKMWF
ncbi:MAG: outer membrane beta-barrel protein [Bdellovibrionales bacterium]